MSSSFEPRVIGFLCNWCSYAAADKAGSAQKLLPSGVTLVRIMCSGRVEPEFVLEAFSSGADGVFVLGCHPGDCHYKDGNLKSLGRSELLLDLLDQFGIDRERFSMHFVSASEGDRFVRFVEEMVDGIKVLGPLDL